MRRVAFSLALCWTGAAFADTTANLGVVSEYIARGIQSSDGVALQGGLDWAGDSGAYLGTWASALGGPAAAGDVELDFYVGWAGKLSSVTLDLGAVYYRYAEDESDTASAYDYWELYTELGVGRLVLQLYYAPDLFGDGNEAVADLAGKNNDGLYAGLIATFPFSEVVSFAAQAGHSSGGGFEVSYGDSYTDYSLSMINAFKSGVTLSFGIYDTTLDGGQAFGTVPPGGDEPKFVAGLRKVFGP